MRGVVGGVVARREQQLRDWACARLGCEHCTDWQAVAGDASTRRYFRGRSAQGSWIAVDAPPATEKNRAFLTVQQLLNAAAVRVPQLLAVDLEHGFMLQEDLGSALLLQQLTAGTADALYAQALALLHRLQAIDVAAARLPAYTQAVLAEELARFPQWYCERLLGLTLNGRDRAVLARLDRQLIETALQQPQVLVHRDFHSRNLLLLEDGTLATIDFQDALSGPLCYDLAALLRDCYVRWSRADVRARALAYRAQRLAQGQAAGASERQFLRWFDWLGLQRHLKVLGTFSRLALRDGKTDYLADIPLVLDYVREVLADYAELSEFADWFAARIEPLSEPAERGNPGERRSKKPAVSGNRK